MSFVGALECNDVATARTLGHIRISSDSTQPQPNIHLTLVQPPFSFNPSHLLSLGQLLRETT